MSSFFPSFGLILALVIPGGLWTSTANAEALSRPKRQAKEMLSGPIISGGTNVCQRGDQIQVMDRVNFGGPATDPSFGPSYRLEFENADSCVHYLAEGGKTLPGKLPNSLAVKVFETLGRHEHGSANLVDFLVRITNEISWVGIKRPFQRPYLSYVSPQAGCQQVRSLVGYFQGQAMISIDEFNLLPAEQQVLTVIHETLRRIQIDYLSDLSPATTMALEQTANSIMVQTTTRLEELPLFKILAQRIADSGVIQNICSSTVKLAGFGENEKRTVRALCRPESIVASLNRRGMGSWAAQVRQQTGQAYRREMRSMTSVQQTAYEEIFEDLGYLDYSGLVTGSNIPVSAATGSAARALSLPAYGTRLNLYSLNYEREDREASCEVLKTLQW